MLEILFPMKSNHWHIIFIKIQESLIRNSVLIINNRFFLRFLSVSNDKAKTFLNKWLVKSKQNFIQFKSRSVSPATYPNAYPTSQNSKTSPLARSLFNTGYLSILLLLPQLRCLVFFHLQYLRRDTVPVNPICSVQFHCFLTCKTHRLLPH